MTTQPAPARRSWDTILTVILLILFLGFSIVCSFAGAAIAFVGDSCGSAAECNDGLIGTALYVGLGGPLVIGLIVLAITIVRLVRKRIAFFVPLIGAVLAVAVVLAAYVTAANAVVPLN